MFKYSTRFLHLILKAQFDYFCLPLTHEKYNPFWKVAWNSRARKKKCWLMRLNSEMYITGAGSKKAPGDELQMVTGQSKSLRWLRRITTKHFSYPTHSNRMTLDFVQNIYTNSLVNATFGSGKKVVLSKIRVNQVSWYNMKRNAC